MAFLTQAANRGSIPTGPYEIDNSLKFERANSEQIYTSNAASGNRKTWTFSAWIKRTELSKDYHCIFSCGYSNIQIMANDRPRLILYNGSSEVYADPEMLLRDTAAWYHIVVQVDSTQSTAADRVKWWINGDRITDFNNSTYTNMSQNEDFDFGQAGSGSGDWLRLGEFFGGSEGFSGYMADVYYLNGTAAQASDFGEYDDDSGIWIPKNYTGGGYGTQGFKYEFKDSSALGTDTSGEGHDANNLGNIAAIDQATDTPTNNFCTINPLVTQGYAIWSLTEGGTRGANVGANAAMVGTFAVDSGKWYWEGVTTAFSGTNYWQWGVMPIDAKQGNSADSMGDAGTAWYSGDNAFYTSTSTSGQSVAYNIGFSGYTAGDIWSISLNCDVSPYEMTIRFNNSIPGSNASVNTDRSVGTYTSARPVFPYIRLADNASDNTWHNFGNPFISNLSGGNSDANGYGDFKYAPPSGYYALCSKNLAEYG